MYALILTTAAKAQVGMILHRRIHVLRTNLDLENTCTDRHRLNHVACASSPCPKASIRAKRLSLSRAARLCVFMYPDGWGHEGSQQCAMLGSGKISTYSVVSGGMAVNTRDPDGSHHLMRQPSEGAALIITELCPSMCRAIIDMRLLAPVRLTARSWPVLMFSCCMRRMSIWYVIFLEHFQCMTPPSPEVPCRICWCSLSSCSQISGG